MNRANITYEAKIILRAIEELYDKNGYTFGKYNLVNHVKATKYDHNVSLDNIDDYFYRGKLYEYSIVYLYKIIDYLQENNYLTIFLLPYYNKPTYMIGDAGRDFLTNNTEIYMENSYNVKAIHEQHLLFFDPKLYELLYEVENMSNIATRLAIYMPDTIDDVKMYVCEHNNSKTISTDIINKYQKILHDYLSNNEPQYTDLIIKDDFDVCDIILANMKNTNITIHESISSSTFVRYIMHKLGIYTNYAKNNYMSKFNAKLFDFMKTSIPEDILNDFIQNYDVGE